MMTDVLAPAKQCKCDICGREWISYGINKPECCRNLACRSRQWDGIKSQPYQAKIRLPGPRRRGRPRSIAIFDAYHREDEE